MSCHPGQMTMTQNLSAAVRSVCGVLHSLTPRIEPCHHHPAIDHHRTVPCDRSSHGKSSANVPTVTSFAFVWGLQRLPAEFAEVIVSCGDGCMHACTRHLVITSTACLLVWSFIVSVLLSCSDSNRQLHRKAMGLLVAGVPLDWDCA